MRNLKRALCFALAAVMVLGLMITGAGAASTYDNFTDKDEIVHQEAVNTMVSLGVINGKEDGSYFDPSATVTRAEMTKVVAVALNGGKDPVFSDNDKTTFTDTQGHWAEKYIAYCVRQGIVAGRGDNSFGPDDPLTGSACAKMFLCALGYRADLEGFVNVGSAWELNVNVKANQDAGLYADLSDITASDDLTRDSMAQMLYNAVQAEEVKYDNLYGDYSGVIQARPQGTMLANRFGVAKVTGILEANDKISVGGGTAGHNDGTAALSDESQVYVTDVAGYSRSDYENLYGIQNFKVDTPDEMVGQEIVLYVKFLNHLSPNASTSTVVGEPIITDNNTVVETTGRLKDAAAVRNALRDGGLTGIGTPVAVLYDEGGKHPGFANGITDGYVGSNLHAGFASRSAGIFQRFIDNNGNGTPDYVLQIVPVLSSVNSVSTSDETYTFTGITGSIPFADVITEEELSRSDVVLITQYADGNYYVDAPETVEGKVTAYNTNNNKITVDGETYGNSAGKMLNVSGVNWELTADMIDGSYIFYLDSYGNILGSYETEAVVGNYCVVTGYDVSGNEKMGYTGKVRVVMQDGTTGTYEVNMASTAVRLGVAPSTDSELVKEQKLVNNGYFGENNKDAESYQYLVDHLFSYDLDKNVITLANPKEISDKYTSNYYNDSNTRVTALLNSSVTELRRNTASYALENSLGSSVANDQTVFFVKDGSNKYYVVKGLSNLPTDATKITGGGDTISYKATDKSTQFLRAAFVTTGDTFRTARSFIFVTDKNTTSTSSGTTIYTFNVVDRDGKTSTMTTTNSRIGADNINSIENTVREYTYDGSYVLFEAPTYAGVGGITATDENPYTYDNVYVKSINGNTVTLHYVKTDLPVAGGSFRVDTNAAIWDVQGDPAEDRLSENDIVAVKIDRDAGKGVIEAAFIYDVMKGAYAARAESVSLDGSNNISAKPGNTYDVDAGGKQPTVVVKPAADTTVKSLSATLNGTDLLKNDNTVDLSGAKDGDKLIITYTVSQSGRDDLTVETSAITIKTSGGSDPGQEPSGESYKLLWKTGLYDAWEITVDGKMQTPATEPRGMKSITVKGGQKVEIWHGNPNAPAGSFNLIPDAPSTVATVTVSGTAATIAFTTPTSDKDLEIVGPVASGGSANKVIAIHTGDGVTANIAAKGTNPAQTIGPNSVGYVNNGDHGAITLASTKGTAIISVNSESGIADTTDIKATGIATDGATADRWLYAASKVSLTGVTTTTEKTTGTTVANNDYVKVGTTLAGLDASTNGTGVIDGATFGSAITSKTVGDENVTLSAAVKLTLGEGVTAVLKSGGTNVPDGSYVKAGASAFLTITVDATKGTGVVDQVSTNTKAGTGVASGDPYTTTTADANLVAGVKVTLSGVTANYNVTSAITQNVATTNYVIVGTILNLETTGDQATPIQVTPDGGSKTAITNSGNNVSAPGTAGDHAKAAYEILEVVDLTFSAT